MYVDEVGQANLATSVHDQERYLSLTGVIVESNHDREMLQPGIDRLRGYFPQSWRGKPVTLHRQEVLRRQGPFKILLDDNVRSRFNADLMSLIRHLDYVVITAVIDKRAHLEKYQTWHFDPYHYCLTALAERYARFLEGQSTTSELATGDVQAEVRGKREDKRLKQAYMSFYNDSAHLTAIPTASIQRALTSRELKFGNKNDNIAGLQLADLIAYPCYQRVKARQFGQECGASFGEQIADIIEGSKFRRSAMGTIKGYGTKWLP
ncbi:MAG TPA: hypothetical protein DEU95_13850 [Chloroflexi bacterium]|jgi:hypothetical protein|nr:hypothetical protein [Chloroflexota bacterium]